MIQSFIINPVKQKKGPNSPDYSLSFNTGQVGADGKPVYEYAGSAWLKTAQSGRQFISVQLQDDYNGRTPYFLTPGQPTQQAPQAQQPAPQYAQAPAPQTYAAPQQAAPQQTYAQPGAAPQYAAPQGQMPQAPASL